jgi:DNA-binding PadR family transcriptional regulator
MYAQNSEFFSAGTEERAHHMQGRHGLGALFAGVANHRGFRGPFGPHGAAFDAFGGFKGPGGRRGAGRARRGDVRVAVLRLLDESPMHGYQIIQELSERSGGAWNPSAGSVYPTLQLLEDEGLVTSEQSSGKRVYGLTETGRQAAADAAKQAAPWDEAAESDAGGELRSQMPRLGAAVWQIAMTGDDDKISRAASILSEARKKLFAILAED